MLVTFSSRSSADIMMFGDIAVHLIKLMGHSGTIPSALTAEDVPAALAVLEAAMEEAKRVTEPELSADDNEEVTPVSLHHRALPLIKMLQIAVRDESYVMWADNS
ncbi:DUF1840 domain-containing protein [Glaciecola sp. 33A]|uniref:DUF1840 domain-containing protein n=1 Tax=Glaciecola sp. 33A TaxID=2057807 RepID=UPI000C326621|nr:DUF1840 domain-containing protein [Glaciecola sp. 33A]PKI02115.1 DUF1840 domain-containing protein [Glaciecola sp. 33A]